MENVKANKGEWSELYTLIKLLKDGRIYAANEQLEHLGSDMFFPIIRIRREETEGNVYDYFATNEKSSEIRVYHNGEFITSIPAKEFDVTALYMYHTLSTAGNGGLKLEQFEKLQTLLEKMNVQKIKAGNDVKADIVMEIIDVNTGYRPLAGFSIKSQIGAAPTLLNASKATNFVYELIGMTDEIMLEINSIDTKTKIIDRFKMLKNKNISINYHSMNDQTFSDNLEMIDSRMPEIVSEILIYKFSENINDCHSLVDKICNDNPLKYHNRNNYIYKFKKLLCSIALGMVPSREWNGLDEANGGYIVVKEDGDIVGYYIYNRNAFESYLLNSTKLEAASTTRHNYATVYKDDDRYFINLNLQIRFK